MQLNESQRKLQPNQYFTDVWEQINEIIVGHPVKKDKFRKRISKVIGEAEKYWQYLQDQRQKSKDFSDEMKDKWFLWDAFLNDWEMGECVYFAGDEDLFVQFYMEEKPKPDPLSYLYSMIWGAVGQEYEGLEVLDYQFILLAIIHDVQNWQAGRELIYFNPRKGERLSDRLCRAVWRRLEKNQAPNVFKDVQVTINTAMLAVRANLEQEKDEHGSIESGEQVKKITKLTDFILNCCEDTTSIPSKANRIHEFVKKGEIKFMPKPINKTKGNQTKLYNEEKLRRIWPKLKEKIKSLPNLKD